MPPRTPSDERRRDNARDAEYKRAMLKARRAEAAARKGFVANVELAAAHNPDIDQKIFREILSVYFDERDNFCKKEDEIRRNAPDAAYLALDLREARMEMQQKIRDRIAPHGFDGTAALSAIAQENRPESMFTPLIRMFHNSDRGGIQLGALGGSAALGGIAYYMTTSSGSGSILTWAATTAATLVGAYIGNKAFPSASTIDVPNFKDIKPKAPEKTVQRSLDSPGHNLELLADTSMPGVKQAPEKKRKSNGFTPEGGPASLPVNTTQIC